MHKHRALTPGTGTRPPSAARRADTSSLHSAWCMHILQCARVRSKLLCGHLCGCEHFSWVDICLDEADQGRGPIPPQWAYGRVHMTGRGEGRWGPFPNPLFRPGGTRRRARAPRTTHGHARSGPIDGARGSSGTGPSGYTQKGGTRERRGERGRAVCCCAWGRRQRLGGLVLPGPTRWAWTRAYGSRGL